MASSRRRFNFGGPPTEFDFHGNVLSLEIFARHPDKFRGDYAALQFLSLLHGRFLGDGQNPAGGTARRFAVE